MTESWRLAGLCRPVLVATRGLAATATQDHILLKNIQEEAADWNKIWPAQGILRWECALPP